MMPCLRGCVPDVHWKNLLGVSATFSIFYSTSAVAFSIQSTLNMDNGLGLITLTCIYIGAAVSCFYAPFVTQKLGTKWTLLMASLGYALFIAGNMYPTAYILIPCALIHGGSTGPAWAAEGTHIMSTATGFASKNSRNPATVISLFNGIFYFCFLMGQFPGSLMMSFLLFDDAPADNNQTLIDKSAMLMSCGARDNCWNNQVKFNGSLHGNYNLPDMATRTKLFTTLLILGLLSFPVGLTFIDKLSTYCKELPSTKGTGDKLKDSAFFSYRFILVAPLIAFLGFETTFFYADLNKSYAGCTSGVQVIGFVTATYNISAGISAYISGALVQYTGRLVIMIGGLILHISIIVYMLVWKPEDASGWEVFVMALAWGVGFGIRDSQVTGLLGLIFPKDLETIFSAYRFCLTSSATVAFAMGTANICVAYKLYFGLIGLSLAMCSYVILEWNIQKPYHVVENPSDDPKTEGAIYNETPSKACVEKETSL